MMTATKISGKRCYPSALVAEAPGSEAVLEFPDGRDFILLVSRRAPKDILEFCASYLPRLRQRPDYRQRRLDSCCEAEFDRDHPERIPATYPSKLLDELLREI